MTKSSAGKSKKPRHLAQRRMLRLNGQDVARTPLLVPSFSSKGFSDVGEIVRYSSGLIDSGAALVSAYDLHYGLIEPPFSFAELLFLDSGGYEASKDADLSDYGDREHVTKEWKQEFHEAQLEKWKPENIPSVIVSYDHPKERLKVVDQIERAKAMAPGGTDLMREILIKPETSAQSLIQVKSLLTHVKKLADFDVIGVTEKEIGNSVLTRMQNIADLRHAL